MTRDGVTSINRNGAVTLRAMFSTPQWVAGEQRTQAEIEADHVMVARRGELVVNVAASDLMIVTAGDLPTKVIDAIRTTLPNAYMPWTGAEDQALRDLWARGVPIADMVPVLGRRYKAIQSRVRKLRLPRRG